MIKGDASSEGQGVKEMPKLHCLSKKPEEDIQLLTTSKKGKGERWGGGGGGGSLLRLTGRLRDI
jgi:hypothetical protein